MTEASYDPFREMLHQERPYVLDSVLGKERVHRLIAKSIEAGNVLSDNGLTATIYNCTQSLTPDETVSVGKLKGRDASSRLLVKKAKIVLPDTRLGAKLDTDSIVTQDADFSRKLGITPFAIATSSPIHVQSAGGRVAFLMEFADGIHLNNSKEQIEELTLEDIERIAYQFAIVREAAHFHGISSAEMKEWRYQRSGHPPRIILFDFVDQKLPDKGIERARVIHDDLGNYCQWLDNFNMKYLSSEPRKFLDELSKQVKTRKFRSFAEVAGYIGGLYDGKLSEEYHQITGHRPLTATHSISEENWEALGEEVIKKEEQSKQVGTQKDMFDQIFSGLPQEHIASIRSLSSGLFTFFNSIGVKDRAELRRRILRVRDNESPEQKIVEATSLKLPDGRLLLDAMLDLLQEKGIIS